MFTRLTYDISDPKERDAFITLAKECRPVFTKLIRIMKEDCTSLEKDMYSRDYFDTNDWSYFHASALGELRAYRKLIKYLKNIEE